MVDMKQFGSTVADNVVIVNNEEYRVSDDVIMAIMPMILGQKKSVTGVKPSQKKEAWVEPDLGKLTKQVGFIEQYDKYLRYHVFCKDEDKREKIRYAIKQAIYQVGGKWNDEMKAFEVKDRKTADAFMKQQEQRVSK